MEVLDKLLQLGEDSRFDICDASCGWPARHSMERAGRYITRVALPNGRSTSVLKILLSNICQNDCAYCALRAGRDTPRTAFAPEELARCFEQLWRAGMVHGIFLSSTVGLNPVREMDRLLATAEILRRHLEFPGFIHLKILPGAEPAQIERAAELADRISINLEAPSAEVLSRLTSRKRFDEQLLAGLTIASRLAHTPDTRLRARSVTTQVIVGAAGETDQHILQTAWRLYRRLGLARFYYSAFRPIPDTPLENRPATPLRRQNRLYQADFLLRSYGFRLEEIPFDSDGNLPAEQDPKQAWALAHPHLFPLEVNRASREVLLRVPGSGPKSASRILQARRQTRLTDLSHLRALGVNVQRAAPFLLLNGRPPARQLSLWPAG
ncbi:MAG: radical SAM protein [Anaerolineae bacterium]